MRIVRTTRYVRDLKRLRVSAEDVARLERTIATDPTAGDLIVGLGGLRKLRFGFGGRGKRGGGRAIYFVMLTEDLAVMIFAYAKNVQSDLTAEQRKVALALVKELTND